jgi:hypothetical protein
MTTSPSMSIAGLLMVFNAMESAASAERKSGDGDCVMTAAASSV